MRKKKILFYSSDGISLGHLQRISQVGKTLKRENKNIEIALVTSSLKPELFGKFFDKCLQIVPLSDGLLEDPLQEARVENANLVFSFFKKFKPDLVVADFLLSSRFTFYPLKYSLDNLSTKTVFIWRVGEIEKIIIDLKEEWEKLEYFEKVFLPYSEEETGDIGNQLPNNFEITGPVFRELGENKLDDCKKRHKISSEDFLITVVLGGGGELKAGKCESPEKIITGFLRVFKKLKDKIPNLKVVISTGPYYYKKNVKKSNLIGQPIEIVDFEENMLELIGISNLVISPAGYNICQEIIQAKTPAILVPLWRKNREQFERAEYLKKMGVAEVLEDDSYLALFDRIEKSYKNLSEMRKSFDNFFNRESGSKKIVKKILEILN